MSLKTPNQPLTPRFYEKLWPVSMQSKLSGPYTKEETKTSLIPIAPLKTTGERRTSPRGQTSLLTIIEAHQETLHTTVTLSTIHRTHYDGCRIRLSQWISVAPEPPTEEEEEASEEGGVSITINPPPASKTTLQIWGTLLMLASNADKPDITLGSDLNGNNAPETIGRIKLLI